MIRTHVEQDAILVITMDRAPANAIDQLMSDGLDAAFNRFEDDASLRVAIVTGAGTASSRRAGTSRRSRPDAMTRTSSGVAAIWG